MDATPGADGASVLLAGRYEVGPLVGLGGTARVHRAWDRDRGCPVAVKVFESGFAPAPGDGSTWELDVLTGVRHPGLVGVHGGGVDAEGRPFVVMDLVDGGSLASRLHQGPLPATRVVRLGAVLAGALAHVHACGVVHRDVKPANVLLDADGSPRLTDFGIARVIGATRVTATGVVVGTPAFMAPEQVRGDTVGPAADVYALGLVLLEAVTGRREYEGGAIESALARLHRAPRVPADVPDPLAAAIRRMTVFDPGERPSASEVADALCGRSVRDPGQRRPAGRRLAPVGALSCLVVAALGGGLMLTGTDTSAGPQAGLQAQPTAPLQTIAAPPPVASQPQAVPSPFRVEPAAPPPVGPAAVPVAVTRQEQVRASGRQTDVGVRGAGRGPRQPAGQTDADSDVAANEVDKRADNRTSDNDHESGNKGKSGKGGKKNKD